MKNLLTIAAVFVLGTSFVHADILWDWTYETTEADDVSFSGSGTLTTSSTPAGVGFYEITGLTGSWDINYTIGPIFDTTITGLVPAGEGVGGINDNDVWLPSYPPQVSEYGFCFTDSSGNTDVIYFSEGEDGLHGNYEALTTPNGEDLFFDNVGTFIATPVGAVPEPSQWGVFAFLGAVAFVGIRRIRSRLA